MHAVVDLFAGIVFLFVLLYGPVSLWVLPAGGGYRGGLGPGTGGGVFLGLLRLKWVILHSLGTALLVGLVLVHLVLH